MRSKFIFICIIFLLIDLHSQSIPTQWNTTDNYNFPTLSLPKLQNTPTKISLQEQLAIKKIESLTTPGDREKLQLACRDFLQQFPQSQYRTQIDQLLKRIVDKDLQLYLEKSHYPPGNFPSITISALKLEKITFQLWQVDLLKMVNQGITSHAPVLLTNQAKKLTSWQIQCSHPNSRSIQKVNIPIKKPGCYMVSASAGLINAITFVNISDLVLVVKRSHNMLLLWSCHRDPNFLGKRDVYLIYKNQLKHLGKTNDHGIYAAKIPPLIQSYPLTFIVQHGRSLTISNSNWHSYQAPFNRCLLYTDQPLYFPGEKLHIKGFLRIFDGKKNRYNIPEGKVNIQIQNKHWQLILKTQANLSQWGTFSIQHKLPLNSLPGEYTVRVTGPTYTTTKFFIRSPQIYPFRIVLNANKEIKILNENGKPLKSMSFKYALWQQNVVNWDTPILMKPKKIVELKAGLTNDTGSQKIALKFPRGHNRYLLQVWLEKYDYIGLKSYLMINPDNSFAKNEVIKINKTAYKPAQELKAVVSPKHQKPYFITWENRYISGYSLYNSSPQTIHRQILAHFSPYVDFTISQYNNGQIGVKHKRIVVPPVTKLLSISTDYISKDKVVQLQVKIRDHNQLPVQAETSIHIIDANFQQNLPEDLRLFYHGIPLQHITSFYSTDFEYYHDREHHFFPEKPKLSTKIHIDPQQVPQFVAQKNHLPPLFSKSHLVTDSQGKLSISCPLITEKNRWLLYITAIDKKSRTGVLHKLITLP